MELTMELTEETRQLVKETIESLKRINKLVETTLPEAERELNATPENRDQSK